MDEQRKLPLEEEKPRLKLSIKDDAHQNQEAPVPDVQNPNADSDDELSVGAHLRRERERQGLSLHDVAEKLRLRAKQLQALEEGDYESLPGQTFVTGFIRSYASTLRLDAVAVVDLYKRENDIGRTAPDLAFPEPTPEGRMPGVGLLMGSSLIALLLFAGWYFYYKDNAPDLEIVQELPQRLLEKLTGSADEVAGTPEGVGTLNSAGSPSEGGAAPSEGSAAVDALKPEIMSAQPAAEDAPLGAIEEIEATNNINTNLSQDPVPETTEELPATVAENIQKADAENTATLAEKVDEESANTITSNATPSLSEANVPVTVTEVETETKVEPSLNNDDLPPSSSVSAVEDEAVATNNSTPEVEEPDATTATEFQQLTLPEQTPSGTPEDPSTAEPVTMGMENATARLVLVANQESWVQVTSPNGETILDRIMEAGDTFMLPNGPNLSLSTANASGLELRLDGEVLGSLGAYGQIVRNLSLEPEALKQKFGAEN